MKQMSKLARTYADMVWIEQDISEDDDAAVEPFVAKIGEGKITCRMALDDRSKDPEGEMSRTWFSAAGSDTMPIVIVVGKESKIAWIGRPEELSTVVDALAAGKFDAKAMAEMQVKALGYERNLAQAMQAGDTAAVLKTTEQLRQARPAEADTLTAFDINLLYRHGDALDARRQAASLIDKCQHADGLSALALGMAMLDTATPEDLTLARRATDRALTLSDREDQDALEASAGLHAMAGEWDKAVAEQQRELDLLASNDRDRPRLQTVLDAYKKKELPQVKKMPPM